MYAAGDTVNLKNLVFRASLFSYYLILIIAIPFLINAEIILGLWLKNVPQHAVSFCILMVIYQMIDAFQAPLNVLISSTGRIRNYNIWLSSLIFLNIPLSWYLLSIGKPPYTVFINRVTINVVTSAIRVVYLKHFMGFPSYEYFTKIILRVFPVTILSIIISYYSKYLFNDKITILFGSTVISIISIIVLILLIGLTRAENFFIKKLCTSIIIRIKKKYM